MKNTKQKISELAKECPMFIDSEEGYIAHIAHIERALKKLVSWLKRNKIK